MSDERQTDWDVRAPLLYGSRVVASYPNEGEAREFAETYGRAKVDGFSGLQIHTNTRTIYIVQDDA